jgi:hypothetical protein
VSAALAAVFFDRWQAARCDGFAYLRRHDVEQPTDPRDRPAGGEQSAGFVQLSRGQRRRFAGRRGCDAKNPAAQRAR